MACKIRPYRPEDREAVRRICCDTGFRGNPIDPIFSDRELFADFFTSYYTDYEPESATVAVDKESGEVVGYLLSSLRFRYCPFRKSIILLTRVIPRGLFRYLAFQYNKESRRFLYWVVFRSAAQTPKVPRRAAHYHINLLQKYRTGPDVRGLMFRFFRESKERGARAIYGQIQITDDRRNHFFERYGFHILDKKRITKFDRHQDEPVYVATLCRVFDD
jgi:hypothetical protein